MRISETMPAGRIVQVFAGVRSRIYPRSQTEPRLASFAEDYTPSPVGAKTVTEMMFSSFVFKISRCGFDENMVVFRAVED